MMGGAGRSIGKRWLDATGPLPSTGRPIASMTRPISPSPTGTSMTRPVRSTSSPACKCWHSPRSTTPISSASTSNAMPNRSPGNCNSSSKPTPGRPDTLAIPIETLVIVPTSRGVNCGTNASSVRLIPANAWSKVLCRLSGAVFNGPPLGPRAPVQARSWIHASALVSLESWPRVWLRPWDRAWPRPLDQAWPLRPAWARVWHLF